VIETIDRDGVVLAYLLRGRPSPTSTSFYTPPDCTLQVGHVVYPAGGDIARHIHLPIERHLIGTGEVLVLQQGRCVLDVYDQERRLVATSELNAGDILVTVGGGHGFRVLEDTVFLEVKQGPYPGGAEKERF
jgi:hypothetical protein